MSKMKEPLDIYYLIITIVIEFVLHFLQEKLHLINKLHKILQDLADKKAS